MSISIYIVLSIGLVCYFILPFLILVFVRKQNLRKVLIIIMLILFSLILFVGVTSVFVIKGNMVYISFDFTYSGLNKNINWKFEMNIIDYVINTIMLIPVGISIVYFNHKNISKAYVLLALVGFLVGISIESLQYFLPILREVQLSDVLLNTLSTIIGGLIGFLYMCISNKIKHKQM